ncbi:MAG: hypothetical protein COA73_18185 [Candidatus Hydrogenedentota bacterium]|nr:MAG: hypothetical protein COA73_18185 [Candidatus Hydrogenedentota bacterium]
MDRHSFSFLFNSKLSKMMIYVEPMNTAPIAYCGGAKNRIRRLFILNRYLFHGHLLAITKMPQHFVGSHSAKLT